MWRIDTAAAPDYPFAAPGYENYIFSTLPVLKTGFPSQMMHSAQEAYQNAVLHITQPGQYVLQGQWHGQIRVDLGEDAFEDESQTVTLILNGVDITCTVASGVLNITAGYEGLNTELHLTINSGHVNIFSQDDGINVNEDGVSVLTVNGGSLHICAGLGAEGDGVDSNGYLVINGGTVISVANPASDSGLDSDFGSFVNGGTVLALGSTMDWAEADQGVNSSQAVLNLRFQASQSDSDVLIITDSQDRVVFAYDPAMDEVAGSNRRGYTGAIVSAPGLQVGGTYRLYVGGKVSGSEYAGMYDPATVTGFTGAVRQCYGGDAMTNMGGGFRPNDRDPGNMGGDFPPEGMQPGQQPQRPDGGQPGDFGQPQQNGATCGYEWDFVLSQTVNAFTSVTALRHDLQQQGQYYVCTACGNTYQDPEGSVLLATGTKAPAWQGVIWPCAISFLLGAATASSVFAIVLGVRRKKK